MGSAAKKSTRSKNLMEQLKQEYWTRISNLVKKNSAIKHKIHQVQHVWTRLASAPRDKGIAAFWKYVCDFDYDFLKLIGTYEVCNHGLLVW